MKRVYVNCERPLVRRFQASLSSFEGDEEQKDTRMPYLEGGGQVHGKKNVHLLSYAGYWTAKRTGREIKCFFL